MSKECSVSVPVIWNRPLLDIYLSIFAMILI